MVLLRSISATTARSLGATAGVLLFALVACSSSSEAPAGNEGLEGGAPGTDGSTDGQVSTTDGALADTSAPLPACTAGNIGAVTGARGGDTAVYERASYDYAPAVMLDGATYKMWWCGGIAGDHILYAEATAPSGPWHKFGSNVAGTFDDVFQPTDNATTFDGLHTCDPSVVKVSGTYYLYYGGFPKPGARQQVTMLGVASGTTGRAFTRLANGNPIVMPARDPTTVPNSYGAGQPSVIFLDGWFYLMFTDTTGSGANTTNGGGQFVWRSVDPAFQAGVEELQGAGFVPAASAVTRSFSLVEAFSADWAFSDVLGKFAVATDGRPSIIDVRFYASTLSSTVVGTAELAASWTEGPGLVRTAEGHLPAGARCEDVVLDILRPIGTSGAPDTWNLAHVGGTIASGVNCPCKH